MSSVLSAAPLLKKVYIPKYIFPLEKCCFAMVNCVFSFVALLLVMIFTGAPFHLTLSGSALPAGHPLLLQPGGGSVPGGGNGVLPGHHAHLERVHHGAALLLRHLLRPHPDDLFHRRLQHAADHQAEPHVLVYHRLPPHPDVGHPAGPQHVCGLRHLRRRLHAGWACTCSAKRRTALCCIFKEGRTNGTDHQSGQRVHVLQPLHRKAREPEGISAWPWCRAACSTTSSTP